METIIVGADESIVIEIPLVVVYINETNLDPATSIGQKYVFNELLYTGLKNGVNKNFVITEAYEPGLMVIYNGTKLKLNDPTGYTISGNTITLFEAPESNYVLEIWGNKQST